MQISPAILQLIGAIMNWDDLKIFLDVARIPKLEAASKRLHIDSTTISRRIKRLETELGLTLFERTRRGHVLTPAGEALCKRVEEIESMTLEIETSTATNQSASGRIRLGVPEGLGTTVIAPALKKFKRAHPLIDVDLIAVSGFVSVPKRQADMSILLARPSTGRLKARRLTDYTLRLYGDKNYLEQHRAVKTIQDLQQHRLVGYVDDLIYSSQLRYFQDLLPDLAPQLCSPSIVAQLEMVRSGAGLGILPAFMAERAENLVAVLVDEISVKRSFWLVIHEDVSTLARNRAMVEFLAAELNALR